MKVQQCQRLDAANVLQDSMGISRDYHKIFASSTFLMKPQSEEDKFVYNQSFVIICSVTATKCEWNGNALESWVKTPVIRWRAASCLIDLLGTDELHVLTRAMHMLKTSTWCSSIRHPHSASNTPIHMIKFLNNSALLMDNFPRQEAHGCFKHN